MRRAVWSSLALVLLAAPVAAGPPATLAALVLIHGEQFGRERPPVVH